MYASTLLYWEWVEEIMRVGSSVGESVDRERSLLKTGVGRSYRQSEFWQTPVSRSPTETSLLIF